MAMHKIHVRQLLDTRREQGIEENTLVVWWSDNGPMYAFWPTSGYSCGFCQVKVKLASNWHIKYYSSSHEEDKDGMPLLLQTRLFKIHHFDTEDCLKLPPFAKGGGGDLYTHPLLDNFFDLGH